jgi:hypothetical protein
MTGSLATKERREHKEVEKKSRRSVEIILFQQENMKA